MATAVVKTETKTIETEVSEKVVKLELTEEEAKLLRELTGSVMGSAKTYRKIADRIYFALSGLPHTYERYVTGNVLAQPLSAVGE